MGGDSRSLLGNRGRKRHNSVAFVRESRETSWVFRGLTVAAVLFFFAFFLLSAMNSREQPKPSYSSTRTTMNLRKEVEKNYCSAPLSSGKEGQPDSWKGYSLLQVQLSIRHGDRSAITVLGGLSDSDNEKAKFMCTPKSLWSWWNVPSSFIQYSANSPESGISEDLLNVPSTIEKPDTDVECQPGELTNRGHEQLYTLGKHLRRRYKNQLFSASTAIDGENELYVRSTSRSRTVRSATSFLQGFFQSPDKTLDEFSRPIHFRVESVDRDPQLGLRDAAKNICPPVHNALVQRGWPKDTFAFHGSLSDRVSPVIQTSSDDSQTSETTVPRVTDVGEVIYARTCHHLPLPCRPVPPEALQTLHNVEANLGIDDSETQSESESEYSVGRKVLRNLRSDVCLRPNSAGVVLHTSDMIYEALYGNIHFSQRGMRTFFLDLLDRQYARLSNLSTSAAPLLAVYSGHDTVIAPILGALGVYNGKWPPYASHISFELWMASKDIETYSSNSSNRSSSSSSEDEFESVRVRVVYNGTPMQVCRTNVEYCTWKQWSALIKAMPSC